MGAYFTNWDIKILKNILKSIITKNSEQISMILTHNENGEYGHINHKAVHLALKDLATHFFYKTNKITKNKKKLNAFNFLYKSQNKIKNKLLKDFLTYSFKKNEHK